MENSIFFPSLGDTGDVSKDTVDGLDGFILDPSLGGEDDVIIEGQECGT